MGALRAPARVAGRPASRRASRRVPPVVVAVHGALKTVECAVELDAAPGRTCGASVLLRELGAGSGKGGRVMRIRIGVEEHSSIESGKAGTGTARFAGRPALPETFLHTLELLGKRLDSVVVSHVDHRAVYHARLLISDAHAPRGAAPQPHEVDVRPSDALTLAVRAGAPVFVAEHLLALYAVWDGTPPEASPSPPPPPPDPRMPPPPPPPSARAAVPPVAAASPPPRPPPPELEPPKREPWKARRRLDSVLHLRLRLAAAVADGRHADVAVLTRELRASLETKCDASHIADLVVRLEEAVRREDYGAAAALSKELASLNPRDA